MTKSIFLFPLCIFLFVGCETVPIASSNSAFARSGEKSVRVDLFRDASPRDQAITVLRGAQLWRTNGREGYSGGEVAPTVSKTIAQSLNRSGVFSRVSGPGNSNADLILKGTISEFNASGKVNIKSETAFAQGSIGGAPGVALAGVSQRGETTEVFSEVALTNLRLVDANTGRTVWSTGRISSSSSQRKAQFLKADADVLFRRAEWELRRAVDLLVARLKSANL